MLQLTKPDSLKRGDKLAAISLSWGGASSFPDRYALGKKRFQEAYGVELVPTRHALREASWLSANPKARAEDLMESFADPTIKGIISIIGGEDSIRTLPYIDFDVIARNPKVFMGYSDSTVTHFMCMRAGLSSYYGPSLLAEFAENVEMFDYTRESVRRVLFDASPVGEVAPCLDAWTGERLPWEVPGNEKIRRKMSKPMGPQLLQGTGSVSGPLIGGCIEVIDWLRGTSLWPRPEAWEGAILFLETSEENPSAQQVKYMLRSLATLGVFDRVKGVLVGRPMCDPDPTQLTQYDSALLQIIRDECGRDDLPILTQMDFGHSDPQMVLPIGQMAQINCEQRSLSLL